MKSAEVGKTMNLVFGRGGLFAAGGMVLLFAGMVFCVSCRETGAGRENAPVHVRRYEQALMQADTAHLQQALARMAADFPLFFEGADLSDTLGIRQIRFFIQDPVVKLLYQRVEAEYGADSLRLGRDLSALFSRVRELEPGFSAPEVYTYISCLDYRHRVLYQDSVLVISIDLYVEGNQDLLDEAGIPRYLSRRLNAGYLRPDVARALGSALLGKKEPSSLLDNIVEQGKVMWFMRQVLPDVPAFALIGYTEEQYEWCRANEARIWHYLVQQDLIFETNPFEYRYFVNDGPFNPMMPGAPARLARFVGWQMVDAYVRQSGADWSVLRQADARTVLEVSRYKP